MPRKRSQEKNTNLVVRVSEDFRRKVEEVAEAQGTSSSEMIRKAIELFIDLQEPHKKSVDKDLEISKVAKEAMEFYCQMDGYVWQELISDNDLQQFSTYKQIEKVILDHYALNRAREQVRSETGLYGLTDTERTVPAGKGIDLARHSERMKLEYIGMLLEPILRPPDLSQEEKTDLKNQVKEVYRLARKTGRP